MACDVKSRLIDTIKDEIKGKATTYKMESDRVFIPINRYNDKIDDILPIAEDKVRKINAKFAIWSNGDIVSIGSKSPKGVYINIHPTQDLINTYEADEQRREVEKEDGEREKNQGKQLSLLDELQLGIKTFLGLNIENYGRTIGTKTLESESILRLKGEGFKVLQDIPSDRGLDSRTRGIFSAIEKTFNGWTDSSSNIKFLRRTYEDLSSDENGFTSQDRILYHTLRILQSLSENKLNEGLAKRLGINSITLINDPNSAALITRESFKDTIFVNIATLNTIAENTVDYDKFIDLAVFEELVHHIAIRIAPFGSDLYNKVIKEIERNSEDLGGLRASVEQIYDEKFSLSQHQYKTLHEGVRMFVQEEILGQITEETVKNNRAAFPSLRELFKRLWNYIEQFFRSQDTPNATELADKILRYIKEEFSDIKSFNENIQDTPDLGITTPEDEEIDKIAKELQNIQDKSPLVDMVSKYYSLVSNQIKKILDKKNTDYDRLRTLFRDENESIRPVSLQNLLGKANKMEKDVEGIARRTRAIAVGIEQTNYLLDLMKEDIQEILKSETNAIQNIGTLQSYLITAKEWGLFLEEARKVFEIGNPAFTKAISQAQGKISDVERYILENDKSGLVDALKPILIEAGEKFISHLNEEIASQNKILSRTKDEETKKSAENAISAMKEFKKKLDFENNREILDVLEGKTADTNSLSVWIESFRDSPDFIISSFTTYLKNALDDVDSQVAPILKSYENEVTPLIKTLGGRFDVSSIANPITVEDERIDKDGNEYKTLMLLNPHIGIYKEKQRLQNIVNQLSEDLKASKGTEKEEEISNFLKQAKKNLQNHQLDYWHMPLKPEFYKKYDLFEDDLGKQLKEDVDNIFDEMSHIQDVALALKRDLTPEEEDMIESLWREYTLLGNLNNLDGTPKTGMELQKAQRMQEIRALNRELFEYIPNVAKFERDRTAYSEELIAKGIPQNSEEYNKKLKDWELANTRIVIKDSWYKKRDNIFKEISLILKKFKNEQIDADFNDIWNDIKGIVYGSRDDDNQPVGFYIQEKGAERIKAAQEKIEELKGKLQKSSGLTGEEQNRLSALFEKAKTGVATEGERDEINQLLEKQKLEGLNSVQKKRLSELFQELQDIQAKIPTEYYISAVNQITQKYGTTLNNSGEVSQPTTEGTELVDFLSSNKLTDLLKNKDFKDWFELNHYEVERWDNDSKSMKKRWERTYQWNRIVPIRKEDYESTKLSDGTILDGVPARKYSYRKVNDKYKTKPVEGKTVDNKGNWLPKTEDAKDTKYINPEYERLKNSKNEREKALFNLLQVHQKYHLLAQEGLADNKKLWLDLPKIRKSSLERNIDLLSKPSDFPKHIWDRVKSKIESLNEFSSGTGNFDQTSDRNIIGKIIDKFKKNTKSDIIRYGTDVNMLPIKYTGKLDAEDTSRNLFRSISKYTYSAKANIKLGEISPVSNAIERILTATEIAQKTTNPEVEQTNRAKAIRFLINREFKGKEKARELGTFGEILTHAITRLGYWSFIPFNYASSVANVIQGVQQNIIDAGNGRYSKADYANSLIPYSNRFVPAWQRDYWENKLGKQSLEGQMIDRWEPIQGTDLEAQAGEKFSTTKLGDFIGFKWLLDHRSWGEFHIQSRIWIAYMNTIKIEQTQSDKSKKTIPLTDAYDLDDKGIIKLKEGIDKEWDFNGKKFKEAKREVQQINRRIQGAFSKTDASQASQFTTYNLALFLNRWFITPAINRWAADQIKVKTNVLRGSLGAIGGIATTSLLMPLSPVIAVPVGIKVGVALGLDVKSIPRFNINSGFQWGWNMSALNAISKLVENKTTNWDILTNEEKRGLRRQMTQLGIILLAEIILKSVQLGAGDDDKKKKQILANMSAEEKMLVYQVMRQEVEGVNFDSPKQYFHMFDNLAIYQAMKKWEELLISGMKDIGSELTGGELDRYKRDEGSIKKGTSKTYVKALKATGLQGVFNSFDDSDLEEFVSRYDRNIRSKN